MFKKGTKLYSITNNKCPRCHEGDFFKEKSVFKFKNLMKLNETCSTCDLKYVMEPSFFYGAMYVNYGITVGIAIIAFMVSKFAIGLSLNISFLSIILALVLATPFTIRLARILWINFFVSYDKDATKNKPSK